MAQRRNKPKLNGSSAAAAPLSSCFLDATKNAATATTTFTLKTMLMKFWTSVFVTASPIKTSMGIMMNTHAKTQIRSSTANIFRIITLFLTIANTPSASKTTKTKTPSSTGKPIPDTINSPTVASKSSNDEFVSALHSELKNPPCPAIKDILKTKFNTFTMYTIAQTLNKAKFPLN